MIAIDELMSTRIVYVEMDDTLAEIREIFAHSRFHHLMVIENKKLMGVISDRDLFKELSPKIDKGTATDREMAALNKKAHQIMTRHPVTLLDTSTMREVLNTFLDNDISCIPIINAENEVKGIVSWKDIFRYLLTQKGNK